MAHAGGRPPRFNTPEEMQQAFAEWKAELSFGGRLHGEVPDVEGFCDYIGSYRALLFEYEKKPEFSNTIKEIRNWIHYRKKQFAMKGMIPAAVYIFDAKNNADYKDRQDVDHTTNGKDLPTPILGGASVRSDDSNT